jgi:putative ABC transport system permease protein
MRLDWLWRDIRFAWRMLRRSYGFTAVALVTMALGVGASAALFSIVRGALLERWPYDGYDRIVTFRAESPRLGRRDFPLWSAAEYRDIAARTDLFDFVIAGDGRSVTIEVAGAAERIAAGAMTANAWSMLGVRPRLGRTFTAEEDRVGGGHVVVLSHRFWRTQFGARPDVVGAELRIDRVAFTIVGVMPPEFVWWDQDVWIPLQIDSRNLDVADRRWYVQARLKPTVSLTRAESALQVTTSVWRRSTGLPEYENERVTLQPLVATTLRDVRQVLYLLLVAVGLVLAVSSANIAMLLLIRGVRRRGEIAVRLALGATAGRVAQQLLTETLLVSAAAGAAGLWLGALLVPPLVALIPFGIPAEAHITVDWGVAVFGMAVSMASGLGAAIVPAVRAVRVNLVDDVKEASRRTATVPRSLDVFMVVQLVLAITVLSAMAAVVRSFGQALAAHPGFNSDHVMTFGMALDDASQANRGTRAMLQRLAALPGVTAVAATTSVPVGEGPRASFAADAIDVRIDANVDAVTPGYFAALGAPLVDGRDFVAADDGSRERVAIVNATAASRLAPGTSVIGRRIVWREHRGDDIPLTVVGVTGDMRRDPLRIASAPAVFVPLAQEPALALSIVVRSAAEQDTLFTAARSIVAHAMPGIPIYAPRMLRSLRRDALGSERLAAVLLTAFSGVVLLLSTIGIYGVTRYIVEQRTGELGVRIALGAGARDLIGLVLRRTTRTVAVGAGVGVMCGGASLRLLSAAVPAVTVPGAWIVLLAAAPLIVVTFTAAYLPARRAGHIDAAAALRAR